MKTILATHDSKNDFTQMEQENAQRKTIGAESGFGYIEVTPEIVYYHYNEKEIFEIAALIGPTIDGANYDSFVLLDYLRFGKPKCVAFIHSVDGLDRTEEDICRYFHKKVTKYLIKEKRHEDD